MNSILSRDFKYTNAASTNIAKSFARVRREQEAARKLQEQAEAEAVKKVSAIKRGAK